MIAIGPSLAKAMWLAVEVETLARQYHGCLQIGTPPLLSTRGNRKRPRPDGGVWAGSGLSQPKILQSDVELCFRL